MFVRLMRSGALVLLVLLSLAAWAAPRPVAGKAAAPSLLFIGKPGNYLEVAYLQELQAQGFQVQSAAWEEVSPRMLRRYNAVIVVSYTGEANVEAGVEGGFTPLKQRFIAEYLKAGGGVLFFTNTVGAYGKGKLGTVPQWLKQFGMNLYVEAIVDPKRAVLASPPSLKRYSIKFAWTDAITPHPTTAGVKNLWYPVGWGGHTASYAVPLEVSHQWTKLVQTGPDATLNILPPSDMWPELCRQNPPKGPYTLLASRTVNNGRLLICGVHPMWTVESPYHSSLGSVIMKVGEQGKPSDFARLFENSYRWLAAPSLQMGIYGMAVGELPPVPGDTQGIDWSQLTFPGPVTKYYRGTVGAHTALSTGKGTVKEWADAAKAAGFDFIIFAEDMAAMNKDKWLELHRQCKAATTPSFIAYPGLEYRNPIGTRGFLPVGYRYTDWFPKEWLTPDGKMLNIDRGWSPQKGWGATKNASGQIMTFLTHMENGYFDYAKGPTPPWDHKLYSYFTVFSTEKKQPLDSALKDYLHVCASASNPAPYALDLLFDPADLTGAIQAGRPHLVVSADPDPRAPEDTSLQTVFDRFVVNNAAYTLGSGCYRGWQGPVATQGPALRFMFRGGYQWEGVEFPRYWIERHAGPQEKDWYMPSWYGLKLCLDADSPAGIKSVTLYDGDQLFRQYDGKGQRQVRITLDVVQAPTRHLIAVVTDANGKQAVSREIWMEQQMQLYTYCGDRVNSFMVGFSPVHGHPYESIDKKAHEVRHFYPQMVSPDIVIDSYSTNAVYKYEELSDTMGWHNWAPHYPRADYTYAQRTFQWHNRHGNKVSYNTHFSQGVYWDGFVPMDETPKGQLLKPDLQIFENTLSLKKAITVDADGFLPGSVLTWEFPLNKEAPVVFTMTAIDDQGVSTSETDGSKPLAGALRDNSTVAFGPRGNAAGYTVRWTAEGLAYVTAVKDGKLLVKTGIKPGARNAAGQTIAWRTEQINRQFIPAQVQKPDWFAVKAGKLAGAPLCELHVSAQDNVAAVEIKRAATDLNCQPIVVDGVNRNWTAAYYEKPTGLIRPIGVLDGKAYAQLPGAKKNVTAIIGNLIRADRPEVQAEMFQETDGAGQPTGTWKVDAYNPTEQPLAVTFTVPAAFDLIKTRTHTATLPARGSVQFTLK
ncbi:MAG: hypothetical protein ACYC7E_03930 [Armatimonadota bacterium]